MSQANEDADLFASRWKHALLKFLYLSTGQQKIAEELTIEILAEELDGSEEISDDEMRVCLLRSAVQKVIVSAGDGYQGPEDTLLRSLLKLNWAQRIIVILVGGLSLNSRMVSEITGIDPGSVRRIASEAMTEIGRELSQGH